MNRTLSGFLHLSRWLSAFAVLVTHLNNRMFLHFSETNAENRGLILYGWTFICGFGHQAVVIFFVLSGFLVGGKLISNLSKADGGYLVNYFQARIVRIYLVLIPALLLTYLLDAAGTRWLVIRTIYDPAFFVKQTNLQAILTNIANLQGLFGPTFGTNGPLATLANEFWYYLTFPLLLAPWARWRPVKQWALFSLGVILLTAFTMASPWHGKGFVLWVLGAIAACFGKAIIKTPSRSLAVFTFVLLGIRIAVRARHFENEVLAVVLDILLAALFANLLLCLRFSEPGWKWARFILHKSIASFTYSLYAIHVPIITLACAALEIFFSIGWHRPPHGVKSIFAAASVLAGTVAIAIGFSRLTEAHTYRVRKWLRG
jgi:peptidoglycan/LPS O-acetylase OafA/YrhL